MKLPTTFPLDSRVSSEASVSNTYEFKFKQFSSVSFFFESQVLQQAVYFFNFTWPRVTSTRNRATKARFPKSTRKKQNRFTNEENTGTGLYRCTRNVVSQVLFREMSGQFYNTTQSTVSLVERKNERKREEERERGAHALSIVSKMCSRACNIRWWRLIVFSVCKTKIKKKYVRAETKTRYMREKKKLITNNNGLTR